MWSSAGKCTVTGQLYVKIIYLFIYVFARACYCVLVYVFFVLVGLSSSDITTPPVFDHKQKPQTTKLITVAARGSFISYLIGFLSQHNKHSRDNSGVHGFLTCTVVSR